MRAQQPSDPLRAQQPSDLPIKGSSAPQYPPPRSRGTPASGQKLVRVGATSLKEPWLPVGATSRKVRATGRSLDPQIAPLGLRIQNIRALIMRPAVAILSLRRHRLRLGHGFGGAAEAQELKVCDSTIALCTIAPCDPIPGSDGQVACHCTVNQGYSVGAEPCQGVKDTPEGQQVRSRYYPVKSYAVCSNDRPWAWCLDKPCIIDKNNPEAATCACDAVKNLGDYVIVTSNYSATTWTTGIISSATVPQITQATEAAKTSKVLTPFAIQVLNK